MNFVRPGEYRIKNIRMTSDNDLNHTVEISSLILEMNIYENMFGDAIRDLYDPKISSYV